MDEEKNKFDRARRLLSRVMQRLVQQSFLRWKLHCGFERTIRELEAVVAPVAEVLDKLPENRTPTDVQRLLPLVSQIDCYRQLHQPVRELLASYLQLTVVSEKVELPRLPADNGCLFSVVYGSVMALMGDPADQALAAIKNFAVEQLGGEVSVQISPSILGISQSRNFDEGVVPSDSMLSISRAPTGSGAFGVPASGLQDGGVSLSGATPASQSQSGSVSAAGGDTDLRERQQQQQQQQAHVGTPIGLYGTVRLWRTVIEVINKLSKLQKAHALRELAAQHVAALEDLAATVVGRAAAAAGGRAAAAAVAAAVAGGGKAGAAAIGLGMLPAAAEESYVKMLPTLAALRTQISVIRTWQSFSGRELVCQEEAGLAQEVGYGALELPGRAIAAVVPADSLAALVYVSREVYHRAMAMQSEISVRRAVDGCCRLPFLRHTPLKELYRLSRHMQEVTFETGAMVLHQGRENSCIYFLVSGEVQVVLDLPDTSDPLTLSAALAALGGSKLTAAQAQALAAHASGIKTAVAAAQTGGTAPSAATSVAATTSGEIRDGKLLSSPSPGRDVPVPEAGSPGSQLPSFGVTRRIVLSRRSSGVVLGDDMLREKRLTVGVVAARHCVCLAVSPQRFTMCCDPLTLRLFHKLRLQHSATALFTESLLQQEQQTAVGNVFREAVLYQSYGPTALRRESAADNKTWKAPSIRPAEIGTSADQLYKQRMAQKVNSAKGAANSGSAISGASSPPPTAAASVVAASPSSRSASAGAATPSAVGGSGGRSTSPSAVRASGAGPGLKAQASGLAAAGGGGGGGAGPAADAPPLKLYGGLTASLVQEVVGRLAETGSMATFLQRIKAAEAEQAAAAAASPYGSGAVVWRDGLPVGPRDLDLSAQLGATSAQPQRTYTDMLEAACMAVIKVELAAGQLDVRLDPLAQVLDDIVVQWSDLAHRFGLQLVRWRTHDYFLITPLDLSTKGGRRPRVRMMADTLLSMAVEFRRIVAQNEIPHLSMCAGMAIGGLFSSYDSGHFLVHCSGQAYAAAQHLCKIACEQSHWQGTIMLADSVAQALARTHLVQFSSGGSVLLGAVGAPPGNPRPSVQQVLAAAAGGKGGAGMALEGEEEEEDEPVSPGTRPFFKRGGGGCDGARLMAGPLSRSHSRHFLRCDTEGAALDDGEPPGPVMPGGQTLVSNFRRTETTNGESNSNGISAYGLHQLSAPLLAISKQKHQQQWQRGQRRRGVTVADASPGIAGQVAPLMPNRLAPLSASLTAPGEGADGRSMALGSGSGSGSEGRTTSPGAAPCAQQMQSPPRRAQPQTTQPYPAQAKLAAGGLPLSGSSLLQSVSIYSQLTLPLQPPMGIRLTEGPIAGGGIDSAANSVIAGAGSLQLRGAPTVLLEGNGAPWRARAYDSQRPAPVAGGGGGRLTANARHRERVANSSSMNFRQQLLQEVAELRQLQEQQLLQQKQQQATLNGQQPSPPHRSVLFGAGSGPRLSGTRHGGKDGSGTAAAAAAQDADSAPEDSGANNSPFERSAPWFLGKGLSQSANVSPVEAASGGSPLPCHNACPAGGRSLSCQEQGKPGEGLVDDAGSAAQPAGEEAPPAAETLGATGSSKDAAEATAAAAAPAKPPFGEVTAPGRPSQSSTNTSPSRVRLAPPPSPSVDVTTVTGVAMAAETALVRHSSGPPESVRSSARRLFSSHTAVSRMSEASIGLAAAAAVLAAAGAGGLQPRPSGVPSRRAPMGYQRPVSPYIPFSAVNPSSDAAVVARGGSPPPHPGPPGTVGTVASIPKLVACNYGYLQLPSRSRLHSESESAHRQLRELSSSFAADGEIAAAVAAAAAAATVESNAPTAGGGGGGGSVGLSRSRSVGVSAPLDGLNSCQYSSRTSSIIGMSSSCNNNGVPLTPTAVAADGADGWGGFTWAAGAGPGQTSPVRSPCRSPSRLQNDAGRSRHASPPGTAAAPLAPLTTTAAAAAAPSCGVGGSGVGGGGGRGGGGGGSPARRRGPSWQDLGSQRAAEQYAASLPIGLMSVSFSTAGLSRVPPVQRLLYLESLALSYNRLVGLASEHLMGLSQNLKILTLVSADLDELPPDFGALLPGLMELNLCSNRLVTLPPTMGSMTRLRCLSAAHNHLASLPPSLYSVATLEHLLLPYNRLTAVDEALGRLRRLETLDLGFNHIALLPSETTALGGSLTRLTMPYNQLQALPAGFLTSMTRLAVLVLDFNPQLASEPQLGGVKSSKTLTGPGGAGPATELLEGTGSRPSSRPGAGHSVELNGGGEGTGSGFGRRGAGGGSGKASLSGYTGWGGHGGSPMNLGSAGAMGGEGGGGGGAGTADGQAGVSGSPAATFDGQHHHRQHSGHGHHSQQSGHRHNTHHHHHGQQQPGQQSGSDRKSANQAGLQAGSPGAAAAAEEAAGASPPAIAAELSFAQDPLVPPHPPAPPAEPAAQAPARTLSPALPPAPSPSLAPRGGGSAAAAAPAGTDNSGPADRSATPFADPRSLTALGSLPPLPSNPVPALTLPAVAPTSAAVGPPSAHSQQQQQLHQQPQLQPQQQQLLPSLRVLSLSAVQLLQVPSWLPAGLQVLDLSRNNLRRLPAWVCRRLAPSLQVLRLHTNRLESLPQELRQLSALQLLSLEENPVASPERINTAHGAGWAAEWLHRKKYRSRPEIMASLAHEHTGLTGGAPSGATAGGSPGLGAAASFAALTAVGAEASSSPTTAAGGVGTTTGMLGAASFKVAGAGAAGPNTGGSAAALGGGRSMKVAMTLTMNAALGTDEA